MFSSPAEQKQSPKEKEWSSRSTKTSEEPNIVKNKSSPQNRVLSNVALRVQCPECNVDMRKDSLPRHRKTKHCNIQEIKCICVDNEECIYMVPMSQRGVKYPLHVQKSFYGENASKISCENQCCMDFLKTCQACGLKNELCDHLKTVTADQTLFPEPVLLSDNIIDEIGVLKYKTIVKCKQLNEKASLRNKNAIVCFDDGQYKHLSVLSHKIHYNAKLGRFIVSYNQKSGTLDCGCCSRKQTCVHKAMSIWFLQQNEMLTELNFKNSNNILPLPTTDEYCGTSDECYPPQDQEKLIIMLKYIRNKEYEKGQLKAYRTFNQSAVPTNILPLEEMCHLCCGNLSKLLSVSTNAKIMTLQGLFENYKSFVKKCIRCGHFYRYQESCHGIHNYDD